MIKSVVTLSGCLFQLALLAGCVMPPVAPADRSPTRAVPLESNTSINVVTAGAPAGGVTADAEPHKVSKGTGVFVRPLPPKPLDPATAAAGPGVTLNFENADLREVVRNILGDVLNVSYIVDPQVQGTVTIRTAREIPRNALISTLETMLRMNGHTIVEEAGLYKVQMAAAAVRGNVTPQLGGLSRPLPAGYNVVLMPLRYVGVREMLRVLEPFAKDAQAIRPDELRNMLILSGTERELRHLLEVVEMFDVDWIAGMSVGLFTLQSADVKQVHQEFERLFGDRNTSPLTGILRVVPIERINALLVISPQASYVEEAKKWIERLDKSGEGAGQRLYVYFMKNGRADRLAPLLQQALTGRVTQPATPTPQLAPGQTPGLIGTSVAPMFQAPAVPGGQATVPGSTAQPGAALTPRAAPAAAPGAPGAPAVTGTPLAAPRAAAAAADAAAASRPVQAPPTVLARPGAATPATTPGGAGAAADGGIGIARNVQIVADKDQNSLLIVATPAEYALIEAALKKLDIAPRQVMIEVTIVEVLLKDEFKFGLEWYFSAGLDLRGVLGGANIAGAASNLFAGGGTSSALATRQGLNLALQNSKYPGGIQAVLNTLAQNSKTKVVSNPHILATDNQKASIRVGDKIPITTESIVPGSTTSTVVSTTTQYLDTGILVTVTPKINAGGLVTLDLSAEVSDPGSRVNNLAPPINSRSAQTLVTVQSGETMVLAGLIRENRAGATDGLPYLSELPLIGALFGTQSFGNNRTELVLFITPRVVETNADMRMATEELRRKMEWVDIDQLIPRRPQ